MLPDFPSVKQKFLLAALKFVAEQAKDDALLSQIREQRHFEGNRMDSFTIRDDAEQRHYTPVSIPVTIPTDELIKRGPEAFMERMFTVAEELKKQKAKLLFERLTEVTSRTGNVVDAAGKGISYNLFLVAFEKVQTDFDSNGNPILQTLVCSPEAFKQLAPKIQEWNADPECKRRFDELVERKRKEWHDRESNRKLVE
jgi:hypothetical protein